MFETRISLVVLSAMVRIASYRVIDGVVQSCVYERVTGRHAVVPVSGEGGKHPLSSRHPGRTRMTCGVCFLYAEAMASPISFGRFRLARMVQGMPAAARIRGRGRLKGIWAGITSSVPPRQLARIGSGRPKVMVSDRIALSMFPMPELWSAISGRAPAR